MTVDRLVELVRDALRSREREPGPRVTERCQLTELMTERGVRHRELAGALNTTEAQVSRWVRNVSGPRRDTLAEIAEYFDVDPTSLTDQDEPAAA
jgi:DNA-binding Xre family transcriptional regulator